MLLVLLLAFSVVAQLLLLLLLRMKLLLAVLMQLKASHPQVDRLPDGRPLAQLSLAEIKEQCALRNLSKNGSRKDLTDRLKLVRFCLSILLCFFK